MGFASAEDTSRANNVGTASGFMSTDFGKMLRRLGGSQKPRSEERAAPVGAFWFATMVLIQPATKISTQAAHATEFV
ncbi:hypothetical protein ON010_g8769 [Phytophthora cinnamomi]|nr:hypothetical protein ON010_g8769 [Phytophthora cinnamomi]